MDFTFDCVSLGDGQGQCENAASFLLLGQADPTMNLVASFHHHDVDNQARASCTYLLSTHTVCMVPTSRVRMEGQGEAQAEWQAGVLRQTEQADLISYGLIPEFVGRFPVIAALKVCPSTRQCIWSCLCSAQMALQCISADNLQQPT